MATFVNETATHTTVILATYNTIFLTPFHVYILVTPYSGAYFLNILNLGPATVYIRADPDPVPSDPETETLPAFCADNAILVPDGPAGLRVMAERFESGGNGEHERSEGNGDNGHEQQTRVTVRLVRG